MKRGDKGATVVLVQIRLAELGYPVGPRDGAFGDMTQAAVILFQQSHDAPNGRPLRVDGVVGPATLWALNQPVDPPHEPSAMPTLEIDTSERAAIVKTALAELGVMEDPIGSNGGPRVDLYTAGWRTPWCALFVCWVLRTALGRNAFPPSRQIASVLRIWDWAARMGRRVILPKPGDLFIMLHPGASGVDPGHGHTGFVAEQVGDGVRTIEGNCAQGVRSRVRPLSSITGFVDPTHWQMRRDV